MKRVKVLADELSYTTPSPEHKRTNHVRGDVLDMHDGHWEQPVEEGVVEIVDAATPLTEPGALTPEERAAIKRSEEEAKAAEDREAVKAAAQAVIEARSAKK